MKTASKSALILASIFSLTLMAIILVLSDIAKHRNSVLYNTNRQFHNINYFNQSLNSALTSSVFSTSHIISTLTFSSNKSLPTSSNSTVSNNNIIKSSEMTPTISRGHAQHILPITVPTTSTSTLATSISVPVSKTSSNGKYVDLRAIVFDSIDSNGKSSVRKSCYDSLPLFIEFGSHHKTGNLFSANIANTIQIFCNSGSNSTELIPMSSQYSITRHYFHHFESWPFDWPNIKYFDQKIFKEYEINTKQNAHIILLSYVRSPLNTIISGFKYHSQCPEKWTKCSMKCKTDICKQEYDRYSTAKINMCGFVHGRWIRTNTHHHRLRYRYRYRSRMLVDVDDVGVYTSKMKKKASNNLSGFKSKLPKYQTYYTTKRHNLIHDPYFCFARNMSLIKRDVLHSIATYQLSVCGLYNNQFNASIMDVNDVNNINIKGINYTIAQRLYFELVRYVNCEFDAIYETHKLIKEYEYGYEFEMEYYTKSSENYDIFIDNLLTNILGFKIGKTIDQQEYAELAHSFTLFDLNRMTDARKANNIHITRVGGVNKSVDALLGYKFVNDKGITIHACELVKDMTIKLDYHWNYTSYC